MGLTWDPPGSCRPQMGPMSAPWTLLSGLIRELYIRFISIPDSAKAFWYHLKSYPTVVNAAKLRCRPLSTKKSQITTISTACWTVCLDEQYTHTHARTRTYTTPHHTPPPPPPPMFCVIGPVWLINFPLNWSIIGKTFPSHEVNMDAHHGSQHHTPIESQYNQYRSLDMHWYNRII